MIHTLKGLPQRITIISSPNYDGTRGAYAVFGEEVDLFNMSDFCYVEWEGDHSKALKDRNKVIDLWQGIHNDIVNPTLSEIILDTLEG